MPVLGMTLVVSCPEVRGSTHEDMPVKQVAVHSMLVQAMESTHMQTAGEVEAGGEGDSEMETNVDTVVSVLETSNVADDTLAGDTTTGEAVAALLGDANSTHEKKSSERNREFEAHVIIDPMTLTHMVSEDSDTHTELHEDTCVQHTHECAATDMAVDGTTVTNGAQQTDRCTNNRKGGKKEKISPLKKKESMTKEILHPNSPTPMSVDTCDSSMSMTSLDMCRICQCDSCEIQGDSPLITPCLCAGSLKYIHQACLQKWIKSSDKMSCELCQFEYEMTKKTKPFREWEKLEMTSAERRKVVCSVTFHIIAITCVIWSLYVLIDRTTEEVEAGSLLWPFWTKLIVVAIGFTGGVVFMYVQCKMYLTLCKKWRMYNKVIIISSMADGEREKANHAGILKMFREKQIALESGHVTNLDVFSVVHETPEQVPVTEAV